MLLGRFSLLGSWWSLVGWPPYTAPHCSPRFPMDEHRLPSCTAMVWSPSPTSWFLNQVTGDPKVMASLLLKNANIKDDKWGYPCFEKHPHSLRIPKNRRESLLDDWDWSSTPDIKPAKLVAAKAKHLDHDEFASCFFTDLTYLVGQPPIHY